MERMKVQATRDEDEFDVTCVTCGAVHLSYRAREARRFITEHRMEHHKKKNLQNGQNVRE